MSVLKKTGSFYLNIGDTYSGSGQGGQTGYGDYKRERVSGTLEKSITQKTSVPAKCLIGIPERLMLRLVDEQGWIRRNTLIWHKPNHMPSSVKDRRTNSYEPIFHFIKSQKYYYDLDSIRIPHLTNNNIKQEGVGNSLLEPVKHDNSFFQEQDCQGQEKICENSTLGRKQDNIPGPNAATYKGFNGRWKKKLESLGKNPIDVISDIKHDIAVNRTGNVAYTDPLHTKAYNEMGKNPSDVVHVGSEVRPKSKLGVPSRWGDNHSSKNPERRFNEGGKNPGDFLDVSTHGYKEAHFAVYPEALVEPFILSSSPKDGVVLDPFSGSGTTAKVSKDLGRNSISIDINNNYTALWRKRLCVDESLTPEDYSVETVDKLSS